MRQDFVGRAFNVVLKIDFYPWRAGYVGHVEYLAAFQQQIAHGFLVLALLSPMLAEMLPNFEDRAMAINYGFDKIRFVSPVPANARIRGRFTLVEARAQPNGGQMHQFDVRVEIEGQVKPAVVAAWLSMERALTG